MRSRIPHCISERHLRIYTVFMAFVKRLAALPGSFMSLIQQLKGCLCSRVASVDVVVPAPAVL